MSFQNIQTEQISLIATTLSGSTVIPNLNTLNITSTVNASGVYVKSTIVDAYNNSLIFTPTGMQLSISGVVGLSGATLRVKDGSGHMAWI